MDPCSYGCQYTQWPLKTGGAGFVAGVVSFNEKGELTAAEYGLIPTAMNIKTADAEITIPKSKVAFDSFDVEQVRSFRFDSDKPYSCSLCSGTIAFKNRTINFTENTITTVNSSVEIGQYDYRNTIAVTIENKQINARMLTIRPDGGLINLSSSSHVTVTCPDGNSRSGYLMIEFDEQERITRIDNEWVPCQNYRLSVSN